MAREYDRAIAEGVLPPVIVVFPNGGRRVEYRDWPDQNVPSETMIMDELMPLVDREYRTIDDRKARGIEGMSMGGNGCLAFFLAFRHPEKFISVVAYAGLYRPLPTDGRLFPGIRPEQQAWIEKLRSGTRPGTICFGWRSGQHGPPGRHADPHHLRLDGRGALEDGEVLHAFLQRLAIPHEYEMLLGVPHNQKMYYERAGFHGFAHHARAFAMQ
ncbi:MAG: alpha/beta hydrolase-fold protein [Bryobacterales bacterium]